MMRLMPLLIAVLTASACGRLPSPLPNRDAIACQVAAAYAVFLIDAAKERAIVFAAEDEPFATSQSRVRWWVADSAPLKTANAPPAALLKQLQGQGNRSVLSECAAVRDVLDGHHVEHGSMAVKAAEVFSAAGLYRADIATISVPVLSADGRRAVLASSRVSGPVAGGRFLYLLELQSDGKWHVIAYSPLWVG